mmetsp:Transcript_5456/g.15199  ORF Transcript_5456/g.15199 Transcript_5456/m.15199 type:complete len:248 (-) Transcript_5456:8-751(-)
MGFPLLESMVWTPPRACCLQSSRQSALAWRAPSPPCASKACGWGGHCRKLLGVARSPSSQTWVRWMHSLRRSGRSTFNPLRFRVAPGARQAPRAPQASAGLWRPLWRQLPTWPCQGKTAALRRERVQGARSPAQMLATRQRGRRPPPQPLLPSMAMTATRTPRRLSQRPPTGHPSSMRAGPNLALEMRMRKSTTATTPWSRMTCRPPLPRRQMGTASGVATRLLCSCQPRQRRSGEPRRTSTRQGSP